MKRRYRERALNDLFARLQSDDFDQREHALFQLAMMLRRASTDESAAAGFEFESDRLPRDLQRMRLSMDDQHRIVEQLALLITSRRESRATGFWTLGEFEAAAGQELTVALLMQHGEELSDEAAYQACRALRRWLDRSAAVTLEPERDRSRIIGLVAGWARSDNSRIALEARAVLELLRADS